MNSTGTILCIALRMFTGRELSIVAKGPAQAFYECRDAVAIRLGRVMSHAIYSAAVASGSILFAAGDGSSTSAPRTQAIHVQVHHRSSEERQRLADNQAADDGDAQRAAQLAFAIAEQQIHDFSDGWV